jgi:tetratricopeptide (TPR) repeat protein
MANRFQSKSQKSVESLPQRNEHWHVLVHHLRVWVAPPDEAPTRPWLVLVLSVQNGLIQFSEVLPAEPDSKKLLAILLQAMQRTEKQFRISPHRPNLISFEAAGMAEALRTSLARVGINSTVLDRPAGVDDLLNDLEDHMRGRPEIPGLLEGRGVTEALVASFYAATVRFYQAAPWSDLADRHPLLITVGKTKRVAVVMGAGGVEYGLAIYNKWRDFERIYAGADQLLAVIPSGGMKALNYVPITEVPFPDLEAIEAYGWPLPDEGIYAVPLVITRDGEAKRPTRAELEWYESALLAIPHFVESNLQLDDTGEPVPGSATIEVPTARGPVAVEIVYPAGELPDRMSQPTDRGLGFADDEFPFLDRRAMEASLAGFGGSRQSDALREAQDQIYEAWEEPQPKRRIALAQKALKLSPDCADAYVLLAEEAAKTVGEALTYYEQGVAAGERALGAAAFQELVGHFWGILETRPYMRARQGLANILSELGRKAEAINHYREMLRLNPGDNQGIRYSLLNLLLEMDDLGAVRKLLNEYDEGSAEWLYTKALVAFREQGANRKTDALLREAIKVNVHVPAYLTARKRIPLQLPAFVGLGDESEAVTYAAAYLAHWRKTEGAVAWLQRLAKKT